jgi:hypothetical protein
MQILPDNLIVRKRAAHYAVVRFITVLTTAHHWIVSRAS